MEVYYLPPMNNAYASTEVYAGVVGFLVDPDHLLTIPDFPDYGIIQDKPGKFTPGGNDCDHIAGTGFGISNLNPAVWLTGSWVSNTYNMGTSPEIQRYKQVGTNRLIAANSMLGGGSSLDGSFYYDHERDRHIVSWGCDPRGSQAYWRGTQLVYDTRRGETRVEFSWSIVTLRWNHGNYSGTLYRYNSMVDGTSYVVHDILSEENSIQVDANLLKEMQIDLRKLTPDAIHVEHGTIQHIEGSAYDFTVADPHYPEVLQSHYDEFRNFVDTYWLRWVRYPDGRAPRNMYPDLGDMCVEAAQSIRANHVNMVALVKELYAAPTDITGMLIDASNVKTLSDYHQYATWYLSGRYGPRLTIADLRTLDENATSLRDASVEHCYTVKPLNFTDYTGRDWSGTCRVNFDCEWSWLNELWRVCDEANLRFTAADAWDMIPYSFVVDWFVDIGGWLEAREEEKFYERMSTFNAWLSSTVSTPWRSNDAVCSGLVTMYSRDNIITTGSKVSLDYSPRFGDHLIDLGALYVQKH